MQPNEVAASADGTGLKASRGREHPSAPTSVVEGLRVREDSTVGGAGRTLSSKDMQPNEVAASADGTGLKA